MIVYIYMCPFLSRCCRANDEAVSLDRTKTSMYIRRNRSCGEILTRPPRHSDLIPDKPMALIAISHIRVGYAILHRVGRISKAWLRALAPWLSRDAPSLTTIARFRRDENSTLWIVQKKFDSLIFLSYIFKSPRVGGEICSSGLRSSYY